MDKYFRRDHGLKMYRTNRHNEKLWYVCYKYASQLDDMDDNKLCDAIEVNDS